LEDGEMKKRLRIVIPVLIILIIASFSPSVIKMISGNDGDENLYYGTVEADQINISSEIPGKIKDIRVEEGKKVGKGDLIAVISSDENNIKLQQAEISVKNAENELGKVEEGTRQEEIKAQQALVNQAKALVSQGEAGVTQAQNNLNSAKTNYDFKEKLYNDAKELYESKVDTKYAFDNAKNQLDLAKTSLDNAENTVLTAKANLESQKSQYEAAKQKLNLLINGASGRTKTGAKLGVEQAKTGYDLAKVANNKGNVLTDNSGVVDSINFKTGEYVTPGSPIATLVDLDNLWVKIYVPEKALPLLKLDKEVTLKSDFLKEKAIKGRVIYISSEAEFTPVNIVTKEDREKLVFAVKIKILDNLDAVKPGMLLDVNID
jgi:HlyD family secretion protein